jgi:hypothetical protein
MREIAPSRSFPPEELDFGVSPSHAANWRPFLKSAGFGTDAVRAVAVIYPMPFKKLALDCSDLHAEFADLLH